MLKNRFTCDLNQLYIYALYIGNIILIQLTILVKITMKKFGDQKNGLRLRKNAANRT
jgi:hypothetical protein